MDFMCIKLREKQEENAASLANGGTILFDGTKVTKKMILQSVLRSDFSTKHGLRL